MDSARDYGEPWVDKTNSMMDCIEDRDGNLVAYGEGELGDKDTLPDGSGRGRRIVAAVNACAGIPTKSLEEAGHGVVLIIGMIIVIRERDEARAMVKELVEYVKGLEWSGLNMFGHPDDSCDDCLSYKVNGHREGCPRSAILAKAAPYV